MTPLKPTKQVLQAFTNLRVNPDFEVVLEWLRENRKTARDELENRPSEEMFGQSQGKSLTLKSILETNDLAPTLLAKYKE